MTTDCSDFSRREGGRGCGGDGKVEGDREENSHDEGALVGNRAGLPAEVDVRCFWIGWFAHGTDRGEGYYIEAKQVEER